MSQETQHTESGGSPPNPSAEGRPTCSSTRKDGKTPCRAPATAPDGRCPFHSTAYTDEQKKTWFQSGALSVNYQRLRSKLEKIPDDVAAAAAMRVPDLQDSDAVEAYIAQVIGEVHAGLLPVARARAIDQLLQTRLKLVELNQMKVLQALEAELRGER